jgi:hypothetical protein
LPGAAPWKESLLALARSADAVLGVSCSCFDASNIPRVPSTPGAVESDSDRNNTDSLCALFHLHCGAGDALARRWFLFTGGGRASLQVKPNRARCLPMISLRDNQLDVVMRAAATVPVEKRSQFLERVAAMLALRGRGHFGDGDVSEVVELALCGLIHQKHDAA